MLACPVVGIFYRIFGDSLYPHAEPARADGATDDTFRDPIRGVAEFGMVRAWTAATILLPGRKAAEGR